MNAPLRPQDICPADLGEPDVDPEVRWKPAHSLAFVVGTSLALWGVVAAAAFHVVGVI